MNFFPHCPPFPIRYPTKDTPSTWHTRGDSRNEQLFISTVPFFIILPKVRPQTGGATECHHIHPIHVVGEESIISSSEETCKRSFFLFLWCSFSRACSHFFNDVCQSVTLPRRDCACRVVELHPQSQSLTNGIATGERGRMESETPFFVSGFCVHNWRPHPDYFCSVLSLPAYWKSFAI